MIINANDGTTLKDLGGISKETIWENPSPTSSFLRQIIEMDLSEYEKIEVVYRMNNNRTDTGNAEFRINDYAGILRGSFIDAKALYDRRFNVSRTYVYFGPGWSHYLDSNYNSEENAVCIPIAIYGIKGVN